MVILNCFTFSVKSQEIDVAVNDTIDLTSVIDSIMIYALQPFDSTSMPQSFVVQEFKPNPTKAVLYSAIFPGLGQVYNRKYWKLPIVYGGFMGFAYAISWNNKNLLDVSQAYKDLTFDLLNYQEDPEKWHQSWQNFVAVGVDPSARYNDNFRTQLKRWRDYYRRNRDLSIILTAGFYLICMADAYVDAQLFDFDISPDLSLHLEPFVSPRTTYSPRLYGFHCSITF